MKSFLLLFLSIFINIHFVLGQDDRIAEFEDLGTNLWVGSYNKFRLTEKLFWRGEFHYRRIDYNGTPYIGRIAQIYNRHALNYIVSPTFNVSLGGVVRLDFTPNPTNENLDYVVPEPRIWHEYLFIMPHPIYQIFHRIRIEHRWSRTNDPNSEWIYRDRWRYKFYMNIPLNKPSLMPGAIYFMPEVELIMQSGNPVIDSPFEDLRISPAFGYIYSASVSYSVGLMYTLGQRLMDGSRYRQRYIFRLNAYVSLDFRKQERKVPSIRLSD